MWGITVDTLALDILMLMLMYTGVNQRNQARSYLDFDYLVSGICRKHSFQGTDPRSLASFPSLVSSLNLRFPISSTIESQLHIDSSFVLFGRISCMNCSLHPASAICCLAKVSIEQDLTHNIVPPRAVHSLTLPDNRETQDKHFKRLEAGGAIYFLKVDENSFLTTKLSIDVFRINKPHVKPCREWVERIMREETNGAV